MREDEPILGNIDTAFDFSQTPLKPVLLPINPPTDSPTVPAFFTHLGSCMGCTHPPPAVGNTKH